MRLWSLHPAHLDPKGLVALWREGLLARAVLTGATRGYRHHPQLRRFLDQPDPVGALDVYLSGVLDEAQRRGYHFDATKITYQGCTQNGMVVTRGQLEYEWHHLLAKLESRSPAQYMAVRGLHPTTHDCFRVIPGPVADWERAS